MSLIRGKLIPPTFGGRMLGRRFMSEDDGDGSDDAPISEVIITEAGDPMVTEAGIPNYLVTE